MKQLTIVFPDGQGNLSTLACIVGAYEVLETANQFWEQRGNPQLFEVRVAGISGKEDVCNGLFSVKPQLAIS